MTSQHHQSATGASRVDAIDHPPLRVSGPDESFLLAEAKLGYRTAIEYCWVLDTDPGLAAVTEFGRGLSQGLLHRMPGPRRAPGARRRWVRSPAAPRVTEAARIDDDAVSDWADEVFRSAELRPAQGLGWQLVTTTTTRNRRIVALLVSHLISDGEAIIRAVVAASAGRSDVLPDLATARGVRALGADLADAAVQLGAAGRSLGVAALRARRRGPGEATPPSPHSPAHTYDPLQAALATININKHLWREQARVHGGTANTLFMGVLCGIARRAGQPLGEQIRLSVAVSKRSGPHDRRANASGGVWLRVGSAQQTPGDLGELRALSKAAFADYATSGPEVPDGTLAVARLLPRRALRTAIRAVPAPDVSASNLGVLPEEMLSIGGVRASSFVLRLMVQRTDLSVSRGMPGPGLSAWIVEYGDRVTLSFVAFDHEVYGDSAQLRRIIGDELSAWGIEYQLW